METLFDTIVIGSGFSGLAAARDLAQSGLKVCVLESSSRVGGRAATRSIVVDQQTIPLDLGYSYLEPTTNAAKALIKSLLEQGLTYEWPNANGILADGAVSIDSNATPKYITATGMAVMVDHLAQAAGAPPVYAKRHIVRIMRKLSYWVVETSSGQWFAKTLVMATPPTVSLELLGDAIQPMQQQRLRAVRMAPVWAALMLFDHMPKLPANTFTCREPASPLAWAALEHSRYSQLHKPMLFLKASAQWSNDNANTSAQQVCDTLRNQLVLYFGEWAAAPLHQQVQLYPDDKALNPYQELCVAQNDVVFCGDWCAGGGAAAALESGIAAAEYIIDELHTKG